LLLNNYAITLKIRSFWHNGIFKKQNAAISKIKFTCKGNKNWIIFYQTSVKYDKGIMVTWCGQHVEISCQRHKIITGFAKFINAKFRHRRRGTSNNLLRDFKQSIEWLQTIYWRDFKQSIVWLQTIYWAGRTCPRQLLQLFQNYLKSSGLVWSTTILNFLNTAACKWTTARSLERAIAIASCIYRLQPAA